jgi:hypothetical protein
MKTTFTVVAAKHNEIQKLDLLCDSQAISITIKPEDNKERTYTDSDFYKCFSLLRKDNPHLTFYCKGAKLNVHPSSMSSQMSLGLKAYELVNGKEPSLDDLVFIFDYEERDLTSNPDEQRLFYLKWTIS